MLAPSRDFPQMRPPLTNGGGIICVVEAKRSNQAADCPSWAYRFSSDPIHSHGKHIVVRRVSSDEEECLLCLVSERIRQFRVAYTPEPLFLTSTF